MGGSSRVGEAGRKQQSSALIELRVMSSRSLRSAQARKRVPSLAAPSLGQDASLSFVVRGKKQKKEEGDSAVGASFPVLPVPGVVPGSLPALPVPGIVPGSLSNGSKGSRDLAI
jgi:hypothetical protein